MSTILSPKMLSLRSRLQTNHSPCNTMTITPQVLALMLLHHSLPSPIP